MVHGTSCSCLDDESWFINENLLSRPLFSHNLRKKQYDRCMHVCMHASDFFS